MRILIFTLFIVLNAFAQQVLNVSFNPSRGFFDAQFDLALSTSTQAASIYYTTDGSIPSSQNGILYSSPISITTTTVIRAAAFLPDARSDITTHSYFFIEDII